MNPFLYRSEYRINDNSDDIVYYSEPLDIYIRVTKEQFLADNPGLTEQDFAFYKQWSDGDLEELYKHNRREGRRHSSIDRTMEGRLIEADWLEQSETRIDLRNILTAKQYHRYVLHSYYGLTTCEIAGIEGCTQQSISFSLEQIRNRIKKYFKGYL